MRTVPSVAIPTTAPVRFDLGGTFDVGGIIFYNASPNTLTVATLDGRQVTCPANYWVKMTLSESHPFDGALLVTAQTQIASTAQSAVMWADVYAPGEAMPSGDSGPLPNQMTAGNAQPRVVAVAVNANLISVVSVNATGSGTTNLTNLSLPASGVAVLRVYGIALSLFSAVAQPYRLGVVIQLQPNIGAAIPLWRGFVADASPENIFPPNPIAQVVNNAGGATSVALQILQTALFNPGAAAVTLYASVYSDMDAKNSVAVPSEGGGFSFAPSTPFPGQTQYIGAVF